MIRQTAGVTDQELTERLRSTALYTALRAIAHKQDRPQGYKLTPEEALDFPPQEEIELRWPSMSPEEILGIERDYERDSRVLQDLDLMDIYRSVEQIVNQDLGLPDSS